MLVIQSHDPPAPFSHAETMSDPNQNDSNAAAPAGGDSANSGEHIPVSTFEVVPYGQTANDKELYAFRESMEPPVEPVAGKKQAQAAPAAKILMTIGLSGLLAIAGFALYSRFGPGSKVSYLDLGSQRFDSAGLTGRLIARWATSGSYQLYLDPISPAYAANFAAVATDPPRQLSVSIRLLDSAGLAVCEKQILFPAPVREQDQSAAEPLQAPQPSETGDTAENMKGPSGQIAEIDLRGPLPCPEKAFATFKAWDFTADFPAAAEESEWQRQEKAENARKHAGPSVHVERLPGPVEGEDVIVADNPSHGTVETSGGRVFFLGAGMRNRTAEWQVFPANIHFRCDKNGICALTRANSNVTLQARLLK